MNQPLRMTGSATIDGTPIFSQLDLTLSPQSWTCLLGASGVGKSTVLRLFAGLAEGVTFDGVLSDTGRVAMMAQQDLLMPWLSVLDNVMLGARVRGSVRTKDAPARGWCKSAWRIMLTNCPPLCLAANVNGWHWPAP